MSKTTDKMELLDEQIETAQYKIDNDKDKLEVIELQMEDFKVNTLIMVTNEKDDTGERKFTSDKKIENEVKRILKEDTGFKNLLKASKELDKTIKLETIRMESNKRKFRIQELKLIEKKVLLDM